MATRLTQAIINRATEENEAGTQLYDVEVSGLPVVVGTRGCSCKFTGRINDGTDRYVSVTIGRTDDVSPRSARERSTELRLALRRGVDPRTPKLTLPTVAKALAHYVTSRPNLSARTQDWYRQKNDGPLKTLAKLPPSESTGRRCAPCTSGSLKRPTLYLKQG